MEYTKQATVYVVQDFGTKNISGALRFGQIKVLLPPNRQIVLSSAPTVARLREGLNGFSDEDYLLLMGEPAAIGIACSIASHINAGKFKMLKWDRQEALYLPININLKYFGEYDEQS